MERFVKYDDDNPDQAGVSLDVRVGSDGLLRMETEEIGVTLSAEESRRIAVAILDALPRQEEERTA